MPRGWLRLFFFMSSYFPLAVIVFLVYLQKNVYVAVASLAIGTSGLIVLAYFFRRFVACVAPTRIGTIEKVSRRDADTISYLVSYVVPFLALPGEGWEKQVALLVFVCMLAVLYVNSGMIHINPMLSVAGYRIYELSLPDDVTVSLITRRRVRRSDDLQVVELAEGVFLEKAKAA